MSTNRAPAPSDVALADPPPFVPTRRRRARVLAVCDGESARKSFAAALGRDDFDVQTAADGLEALARAVARRPDVVVIDVAVRVIDGWEVVRRLKAAAATREIPVIALTTGDRVPEDVRASAAGVACLAKPCCPEDLRDEVRRQLGQYRPRPRRRGRAGRA